MVHLRHSLVFGSLLACSGTAPVDPGPLPGADAAPPEAAAGPILTVRLRTSTAPFPHADGWSGQTSQKTKQGVRSFRLLRAQDDPSPVVVFDHGSGYVEAGYDDGDDTVLGSASLAAIPAGKYALARIVVTHSRFRVRSTMHAGGAAYPGDFDCVQALSDDATVDGAVRSRGWYRYVFAIGGQEYPQEGSNAPLPAQSETGGFVMKTNGGETFYELPVTVVIPTSTGGDVTVVIGVNMHEAFRWQDLALPGYAAGVYDTTPVSFEPVQRYGANTYTLSLE